MKKKASCGFAKFAENHGKIVDLVKFGANAVVADAAFATR